MSIPCKQAGVSQVKPTNALSSSPIQDNAIPHCQGLPPKNILFLKCMRKSSIVVSLLWRKFKTRSLGTWRRIVTLKIRILFIPIPMQYNDLNIPLISNTSSDSILLSVVCSLMNAWSNAYRVVQEVYYSSNGAFLIFDIPQRHFYVYLICCSMITIRLQDNILMHIIPVEIAAYFDLG